MSLLGRCVDELDLLLEESSSLKILHFYQPKLLLVSYTRCPISYAGARYDVVFALLSVSHP